MERILLKTVTDAFDKIISFLPEVIAALTLLLVGILAALLVKRMTVRFGSFLKLHRLSPRLFAKGDVRNTFMNIIGNMLGFIIFLIFLDSALVVLRLHILEKMVNALVFFIPNLILSGIIFGAGLLIANRVASSTEQLLSSQGFSRSYLISRMVRTGIMLFVIALALLKLEISKEIILYGFAFIFGSIGLAFVLAVGLGSKDAVKKAWEILMEKFDK
jgi:hypothetical protein